MGLRRRIGGSSQESCTKCQIGETTAQIEESAEMERREVRIGGGIDQSQDGRLVDVEGGAGQTSEVVLNG